MLSSLRSFGSQVTVLGAVLIPFSALAQTPHHIPGTPADLLAAYVHEHQAGGGHAANVTIMQVLTHYGDYESEDVESLLNGLEQLALTSPVPRLRAEAAYSLSVPGANSDSRPPFGIYARLARVYDASNDPLVRMAVLSGMGRLRHERREAALFLERVATQEPQDFQGVAGKAMASLLTLGDEGRKALKRMNDAGTVRDPEARSDLARLAKRGYRLE